MRQFRLLLPILLAAPAGARVSSISPEMDRLLMEGIDAIYRMDFAAADAAADRAIALDPADPHPYLGRAATDLIRYVYGTEQSDESLMAPFAEKVERALPLAEKRLKERPGDPDVMLALGAGYGFSARLALSRREFLKVWRHGTRAMKYVRAAVKADPQLWDAYLGTGMFDWYIDTIPRGVGRLAKVMLGGSRERGLRQLKLAAEKGRYARLAAQLILVEIYTEDPYGAANTAEGARLMAEIRARYPDSAMLHSAGIVSQYADARFADAERESREYLARVAAGRYPPLLVSKGRYQLGLALWAQGRLPEALAEFSAGASSPGPLTRWTVWCRAREGQALDALGRREEALASYRLALKAPDRWDLRGLIKPCLSKPCVGDKYPGRFSPY